MSRLFVKIKTDPKLKGTLFEIQGKSKIGETLDQIIRHMGEPTGQEQPGILTDYQIIRLGSPKRILDKHVTFMQADVRNNDVLLLTTDADSFMANGVFDFETFPLESQYTPVQDIRASLRMPSKLKKEPAEHTGLLQEVDGKETSSAVPNKANIADEVLSSPRKEKLDAPFEFQPLDIEFPDHDQGTTNASSTSKKITTDAKKKGRK